MTEQQEEPFGPFSMEKAYQTYQENISEARKLKSAIEEGRQDGTATERELLLMASEALGRLTDNTILKRIVEKGLEAREKK